MIIDYMREALSLIKHLILGTSQIRALKDESYAKK
jgi:hypothetical protein